MQDLAALVRELIVDPLAALVHAFHEARALQLLEMLQERRLAQAKEVAQIRDRLASCVETFQHLDPDIRREGAEAFLVQRDLASAGVHAHEPWAHGFMNDSLRFGRNLTIRVVAAPRRERLLTPPRVDATTRWNNHGERIKTGRDDGRGRIGAFESSTHARNSHYRGRGSRSGMTGPPAAGPKVPPPAGPDPNRRPAVPRRLSGPAIVIWAVIA